MKNFVLFSLMMMSLSACDVASFVKDVAHRKDPFARYDDPFYKPKSDGKISRYNLYKGKNPVEDFDKDVVSFDKNDVKKSPVKSVDRNPKSLYGVPPEQLYGDPATVGYNTEEIVKTLPSVVQNNFSIQTANQNSEDNRKPILLVESEGVNIIAVSDDEQLKDAPISISEPKFKTVLIKKGDTLYSVSKNNQVPLKDLILVNNIAPPYILTPGQIVKIPMKAFHIVRPGDTLYNISKLYNVQIQSIATLNGITEPFLIALGQNIQLPASASNLSSKTIAVKSEKSGDFSLKKQPQNVKPTTTIKTVNSSRIPPVVPLTGKFIWPVKGKILLKYGPAKNGLYNDGINISAVVGTKVKASENGVVGFAGDMKGLGNLIIIKHQNKWMTVYSHLDSFNVNKDDNVKQGDFIGTVGKTGRISQSQLHFEIRKTSKNSSNSLNPLKYLK